MRGGQAFVWSAAVGVSPTEVERRLQSLWREQEDLYSRQSRLRDQLHSCPDRELDEHLLQIERHMGEAATLIGNAVASVAGMGV